MILPKSKQRPGSIKNVIHPFLSGYTCIPLLGIMHYSQSLFVVFLFRFQAQLGGLVAHSCSLSLSLQKQRSTKHTNSRQRASSHSRRRSRRALRSRSASRARRAGINRSSGNANTVAGRSLHARARTGGHSGSDDRRSSSASLAAAPRSPGRVGSAPGTFGPAAPGGSRAGRAAPPACPWAFSPGA